MAAGPSEDTSVQLYQYRINLESYCSELDPEQYDSRKDVRQLRLEQDFSEWLGNVMSICMYVVHYKRGIMNYIEKVIHRKPALY